MNNIAIAPYIGMYALQNQNIKRNVAKTASVTELNKSEIIDENIIIDNTIINEESRQNSNTDEKSSI